TTLRCLPTEVACYQCLVSAKRRWNGSRDRFQGLNRSAPLVGSVRELTGSSFQCEADADSWSRAQRRLLFFLAGPAWRLGRCLPESFLGAAAFFELAAFIDAVDFFDVAVFCDLAETADFFCDADFFLALGRAAVARILAGFCLFDGSAFFDAAAFVTAADAAAK